MKPAVFLAGTVLVFAQAQIKPVVSQRTMNEQVNVVRLAPRYATAIRLPEPVSSVVVGDPVKFLAEHSDKEPTLVLVKPASDDVAESNLLITTVNGRHLSFLLRNEGGGARPPVDFVVTYRPVASFLVEESAIGAAEVPGSASLAPLRSIAAIDPVSAGVPRLTQARERVAAPERDGLTALLERQQRAQLPTLFGMRTTTPDGKAAQRRRRL